MAALKRARLVAETIVVCCPHCDAEQPAPDNGSDMWLPDQIEANQGKRECVSCDEAFHLQFENKIAVELSPARMAEHRESAEVRS